MHATNHGTQPARRPPSLIAHEKRHTETENAAAFDGQTAEYIAHLASSSRAEQQPSRAAADGLRLPHILGTKYAILPPILAGKAYIFISKNDKKAPTPHPKPPPPGNDPL